MFRRGLFYTYLSIYLKFFLGLSVSETTLFATIPMVLNIVFQTFVWGTIADRFQLRRTLVIVGEMSASVITVAVWWTHTLPSSKHIAGYVLIVGLTVVEIFWSMSNVGWSALISDLYEEKERTGLQGNLSSIGAITRFGGVWAGGLMYDGMSNFYDGWGFHSGPIFFFAALTMALSAIPMLFLPEGGSSKSEENPDVVKIVKIRGLSKQFSLFLLAMMFIHFGRNSMAILRSQYLVIESGFDVSSIVLGHIINTESAAIFICGILIKKLSRKFNDSALLVIGTVLTMVYLIGFTIPNMTVVFISAFISGLSWVMVMASSYTFASRLIPPEKRGKQFALFNATFFLSWGIPATFITGPLIDILINIGLAEPFAYRMAFLAAAVIVGAGLITLKYVKKEQLD